ncbi:MAG: four-carbon acid sugar kinase family protein, partial [Caldilineaceae bacterium]|nr:four-carbon acid sugar kinase family protein [Caldilineaceae bacterium]
MTNDHAIKLSFYGDDFTGSTDALEALTLGGMPAALFTQPPTPEQLAHEFPQVRAVGVAGTSRAMTPTQMDETLPAVFTALRDLDAPLCHYKVCSTFDSSPTIGSIGRALEIGLRVFAPRVVPIVVGTPMLRRFVAFGNLFATVGAADGSATTYRIDRHPMMAHHPVTPMHESDLRRHLAQQTNTSIGLIDLLDLTQPDDEIDTTIARRVRAGQRALLFDTIDHQHLHKVGRLLQRQMTVGPLFAIGSSGVESALTAAWQTSGMIDKPAPLSPPPPVDQIVVMAGSASAATAEQIDWAERQGFATICLDAAALTDATTGPAAEERYCQEALQQLAQGQSVQLYSTRGPLSPLERTDGEALGKAQGRVLHRILDASKVRRICVAGGDTCGRVVQQLEITAMTVAAPLAPGAPLCRAH